MPMSNFLSQWVSPYLRATRLVKQYYPRYTLHFLAASAFFVFIGLANTAVPYLLGELTNMLSQPATARVPALIMGVACAYAATWTVAQVLVWLKNVASAAMLARCENAMYRGMFHHLIRLRRSEQKRLDAGVVIAEMTRARMSFGMINLCVFWIIVPIVFELCAVYLVLWSRIDLMFAVSFTIAILMLFVVAFHVANRTVGLHSKMFGAHNSISSHLSERLRLLDDIRYNNAYGREQVLAEARMSDYVRTVTGAHLRIGGMMGLQTVCVGLILTAFTLYVTQETLAGVRTVGDFVMVAGYISQLTAPFMMIAGSLTELKKNYTALNVGLAYVAKEQDKEGPTFAPQDHEAVFELRAVRLWEAGTEEICYRFEAGKMHAIGGPSGVGKTTLLHALLGLVPVASGEVRFFGARLSDVSPEAVFSRVAMVPQDAAVISGTLRDNLTYGCAQGLSDTRLLEIVKALGLGSLKRGTQDSPLDIEISPSDPLLSGGERQRIGIARALARDVRTIVLDEPTSALDLATEISVLDALRKRVDTLIVVSHRQAVLDLADSVLMLAPRLPQIDELDGAALCVSSA
jgi:ATP-binding cassette subfamily B protein